MAYTLVCSLKVSEFKPLSRYYAHFKTINWLFGLVGRVFANGPGDLGSIPGRIIQKIFKMVLDTSLLNL